MSNSYRPIDIDRIFPLDTPDGAGDLPVQEKPGEEQLTRSDEHPRHIPVDHYPILQKSVGGQILHIVTAQPTKLRLIVETNR